MKLQGKKGLVVGIANDNSIAYGCARALRAEGADLAITCLNEKAEPLMKDGGCLQTVTFFGSARVVEHYNMMGPVPATAPVH